MMKRTKLLWVLGAILLAVGGAALASNMGFKFVPNIATADPDVYDVSLPLNNNYTDLASIYNDINGSAGCSAASVTVFNPDQSACAWTGPFSCNTAVASGQGIRVTTGGACTGWVIVGSHNPAFSFSFPTADPDIYDVSVPYHTTKTDLAGLFSEIPNAYSVTVFNPDQSACAWTGPFSCNTTLTIGQGVRVTVSPAGTPWTPSHY